MKNTKFMTFLSLIILFLGTNSISAQENNRIGYLKIPGSPNEVILKNKTIVIEGETIYTRSNGTRFFLNSIGLTETQQIKESDTEFVERIKERQKERNRQKEKIRELKANSTPFWKAVLWIFGFVFTFILVLVVCRKEGIAGWINAAIAIVIWIALAMCVKDTHPSFANGVVYAAVIIMILGPIISFLSHR